MKYPADGHSYSSHPGRQSPIGAGARGLWAKTVAPSRVPLDLGPGIIACTARKLIFGTPRELEEKEIEDIVERFVSAAKLSHAAGFKGVELHAARMPPSVEPLLRPC